VPLGLGPAEAVSLILNYVTASQMLHRSAKVRPGQRVLIHGASGGVGTALLQLGRLAGLEMYGTCSSRATVTEPGGAAISYRGRHRFRSIAMFALSTAWAWLLPGQRRVVPYSIQWVIGKVVLVA